RAYAADHGRTELLVPLARFHGERGEWEPARDYYRQAIQRGGVAPAELKNLEHSLADAERHLAEVKEPVTAPPISMPAPQIDAAPALARGEQLLEAVQTYRRQGDLASALEHLIAAADSGDLEPARAAACALEAADVFLAEGDPATAERLYRRAAVLAPGERAPLDALCRLASARGDHQVHAELLSRAAA